MLSDGVGRPWPGSGGKVKNDVMPCDARSCHSCHNCHSFIEGSGGLSPFRNYSKLYHPIFFQKLGVMLQPSTRRVAHSNHMESYGIIWNHVDWDTKHRSWQQKGFCVRLVPSASAFWRFGFRMFSEQGKKIDDLQF